MATFVIRTKNSRSAIAHIIRSLPGRLAGNRGFNESTLHGKIAAAMAHEFFKLVTKSYKMKARGARGEDGITWRKNTRRYVAYGKGTKATRFGAGQMPNNWPGGPGGERSTLGRARGTGELDSGTLRQWWRHYLLERNRLMGVGVPMRLAKARAAQYAYSMLPGYETKLETIGDRKVKIGISRGKLSKSLEPGSKNATKPQRPNQILKTGGGRLEVGTKCKHAQYFHARRPLWPARMPAAWNARMREVVTTVIREYIEKAAK